MSTEKSLLLTALATAGFCLSTPVFSRDLQQVDESRGKYLIEIGGCNDCHTAGFAPSGGAIPEAKWLLGDSLGFRGPWGTTYPTNLRQFIQAFSEDKWVSYARNMKTRPPMPWWALNAMTDGDLRAVYRYIKGLGSVKTTIPSYVPPGEEPNNPYIQWPETPK